MNEEAIKIIFPEGFPVVPPGAIHPYPNPIVQLYLGEWRSGKISMEAAYCSIIHCLLRQVDHLEGFIEQAVPKVPEPTLVETNEEKTSPKEDTCQPASDKVEQVSSGGVETASTDNKTQED